METCANCTRGFHNHCVGETCACCLMGHPSDISITNRHQEAVERMREVSGRFQTDDHLVAFLYLLARDEVTTGVIDGIIDRMPTGNFKFTNGWLAQWAQDARRRLTIGYDIQWTTVKTWADDSQYEDGRPVVPPEVRKQLEQMYQNDLQLYYGVPWWKRFGTNKPKREDYQYVPKSKLTPEQKSAGNLTMDAIYRDTKRVQED